MPTTFFNLGTKESVGNSSLFSFDHPFHGWILRSKSQNGERKFSKPTGQLIRGTELVLELLVNPGSFQFLLTGLCGWKYNNEDLGCFEFISKNKENYVPSLLSHLSGLTFCSLACSSSLRAGKLKKNCMSFSWVPLSVKLATRVASEKILSPTKSFAYGGQGRQFVAREFKF